MCRESAVPRHGSASWTFTEGRLGCQARKEILSPPSALALLQLNKAGAWRSSHSLRNKYGLKRIIYYSAEI
jgi:hypothetical protein